MGELVVTSLSEYIRMICDLYEIKEKALERKTTSTGFDVSYELLYRGQASRSFELLPSLARGENNAVKYERRMIHAAKEILPGVFESAYSQVDILALMQHFGMPTRMLDVTENALVALYFACCSNDQCDGEVLVFLHRDISSGLEYGDVIANTSELMYGLPEVDLDTFLDVSKEMFVTKNPIHPIRRIKTGEELLQYISKPVVVAATIRAKRQKTQSGKYILFPNVIKKKYDQLMIVSEIEQISKSDSERDLQRNVNVTNVLVVPAGNKKRILRDLSLIGLGEAALFPEDIDAACKDITQKILGRSNR